MLQQIEIYKRHKVTSSECVKRLSTSELLNQLASDISNISNYFHFRQLDHSPQTYLASGPLSLSLSQPAHQSQKFSSKTHENSFKNHVFLQIKMISLSSSLFTSID